MDLGHLIVGHVDNRVAAIHEPRDECISVAFHVTKLYTDKNVGIPRIRVPVIELGDGTGADGVAELPQAAGMLGDGDRQQRFPAFTQLGALRNMAQAIEVDIGTEFNYP